MKRKKWSCGYWSKVQYVSDVGYKMAAITHNAVSLTITEVKNVMSDVPLVSPQLPVLIPEVEMRAWQAWMHVVYKVTQVHCNMQGKPFYVIHIFHSSSELRKGYAVCASLFWRYDNKSTKPFHYLYFYETDNFSSNKNQGVGAFS